MLERRFQTVITQNLCTFDALRMREVLTPSESEPHSNIVVVIDPNLPVNLVFPWGGGLGVSILVAAPVELQQHQNW